MAGRNAAAAQAALLLTLQIWESLINDKYMKEACQYDARTCPTCNSPRACNNHFCLQCKTGGLCPIVFRGNNEHRNHSWLQVRHYSRQYSILAKDLGQFISKEGLKHIQTNKLNAGQKHCNLRSKGVAEASSSSSTRTRAAGEKSCQGCMASIRGSKNSKESFLVCSLQCLVQVARERQELVLLEMKDGAMEHMKPPLLYTEKLLKRPRMLETPTKTPMDEALPFPLVTQDYPMFGTPAETSTGEALPVPPVIEDFPMLETPIGEALPFPPVIEDFPMFEKPAAPAETPKLETFSLPLKFQAFDDWEAEDWMWI